MCYWQVSTGTPGCSSGGWTPGARHRGALSRAPTPFRALVLLSPGGFGKGVPVTLSLLCGIGSSVWRPPSPFMAVTLNELQPTSPPRGAAPSVLALTPFPLLCVMKFLAAGFSQGQAGSLPASALAVKL